MSLAGLGLRIALLVAVLAIGISASGCAAPGTMLAAAQPIFAGAPPGGAQRVVVIAVANPRAALSTQAGTTPGLYESTPRYAVGAAARRLLDAIAREHRLTALVGWPIPTLGVYCATFLIPADMTRDEALVELAKDPRIAIAQPLNQFETLVRDTGQVAPASGPARADGGTGYNDPYLPLQHGLQSLDVLRAHRCGRGAGVTVAVIDTGVDTAHVDLRDAQMASENFVDDDARQFLRDFHGTAVAGIIAATPGNGLGIVGIAPEARLLLLKACWQGGAGAGAQCNSFTLAQALSTAIDRGVQVINLSLGGPADDLLARLVRQAIARGIVVVGAIPPSEDRRGFPASVPGVIAVREGSARMSADTAFSFTGRDILTLSPGGRFDFSSGSSLSAAQISAVAALLLQHDPRLSGVAVEKLLRETASRSSSGTPDAFEAITAVDRSCVGSASR